MVVSDQWLVVGEREREREREISDQWLVVGERERVVGGRSPQKRASLITKHQEPTTKFRVVNNEELINKPSKKSEGKKRQSPCTPYREKGKGKELAGVSIRAYSPCAGGGVCDAGACGGACKSGRDEALTRGVRARMTAALVGEAVKAFKGTPDDGRLWAAIAWRVGMYAFADALWQKKSEDFADGRPRRPAAAFTALLCRRFPKGGAK